MALKVLPFAAVLDCRQIARFKHEAQAAAQLDHPNIVSVFAVGVERGVHYYAMQFIDGQPLDRALAELRVRLARAGGEVRRNCRRAPGGADAPTVDYCPATPGSLLTADRATSRSTSAAWSTWAFRRPRRCTRRTNNGVVHRDVKPSNLLLDGSGKFWVTDFGLARCQTDATLTRTGDLVGTLRYMSPEQATGQSALVDHRTDIYSLGATLYELLTLQPAFRRRRGACPAAPDRAARAAAAAAVAAQDAGGPGDGGPEGHGQTA